jgi:hypothetical protein
MTMPSLQELHNPLSGMNDWEKLQLLRFCRNQTVDPRALSLLEAKGLIGPQKKGGYVATVMGGIAYNQLMEKRRDAKKKEGNSDS